MKMLKPKSIRAKMVVIREDQEVASKAYLKAASKVDARLAALQARCPHNIRKAALFGIKCVDCEAYLPQEKEE